jgi:hypothetical protein
MSAAPDPPSFVAWATSRMIGFACFVYVCIGFGQ